MRKIFTTLAVIILAVAVSSALPATVTVRPAAAADTEKCIGDWARAAAIVERRKMIDVAGLGKLAREKYNGRIITARLCQSGGNYFYRLMVRGDDGRMQQIKVDVSNPAK